MNGHIHTPEYTSCIINIFEINKKLDGMLAHYEKLHAHIIPRSLYTHRNIHLKGIVIITKICNSSKK